MNKAIKLLFTASLALVLGAGAACSAESGGDADLVVYGKIFTAENNQLVEAFAVKDGKYV